MAQLEFTGLNQTFSWNSVPLEGVRKVTLVEEGGPAVEQLDVTTCTDSAYTFIPDPLGAKGNPTVTMTVELQDSYASYADNKQTDFAFNDKQAVIWMQQPATGTANQYDHTALELTSRTTEIFWDQYAVCTLVFEGTVVGTWSSPA
jgi:hypothetical protein